MSGPLLSALLLLWLAATAAPAPLSPSPLHAPLFFGGAVLIARALMAVERRRSSGRTAAAPPGVVEPDSRTAAQEA